MHQTSFNNLRESVTSNCADLSKMAERELTSFFNAVASMFGDEQAELSAQDWLKEVAKADHLPESTREWRRISLAVSSRLATRVSWQHA
jgi:hypothetical protein